jgi:MYXO-CTERM domain-containing protein
VRPNAVEVLNGRDDDCDGVSEEPEGWSCASGAGGGGGVLGAVLLLVMRRRRGRP